MHIPTREDWGELKPNHLDYKYAFKNFFGKSGVEAEALFADDAPRYGEDLYYMTGVIFGFYLQSFKNDLLSEAACNDSAGASSFLSVLDLKSTQCPADLLPYWGDLEPLLEMLAIRQGFFGADWSVDGDFRWRIGQIVQRGFPVSFDVSGPESVPAGATVFDVAQYGSRQLSLDAAVRVIQNSGFPQFHSQMTRLELLDSFGEPPESGGGFEHLPGIPIPKWVAYRKCGGRIHIIFQGETISSISFSE